MRFLRHKKTAFILAILFLVAIGFWLNADIAQAAVSTSNLGKGFTAGATKVAEVAGVVLMVYGILALLGSVLHGILGILGFFLDNVASWNLITNPSQMEIVHNGWTVMRDLTNGLFILIILWIAITIIFNLENLGGKRLLIRVIVIALLINFSLAMVSAVFGFANALAKPFHTAIGLKLDDSTSSLSGILIAQSAIHEISAIARAGEVDEFKKSLDEQARAPQTEESQLAWLWHSLGAPREAQANLLTILQKIGVGIRMFGVQAAGAVAGGLGTGAVTVAVAGLFGVTWQGVVNQFISDGFLLLMAVALFTATIIFALRIAAMIFIGIFAPIAFAAHVIPKYGDRFWNQWLEYLFNWAFVAPVFYFLLYITLLMLDASRGTGAGGLQQLPFSANAVKMFNFALFLVLFFTTIRITRKMGGAVAETALNMSKRLAGFGLGVTTGFVAKRALPKLGKAAEAVGERIGRIESPVLRRILRTPAKALRGVAAAGRESVLRAQQRLGSMTSAEIQRAIGAGEFGEAELAAAILLLQGRRDLTPIRGVTGYGEPQQRRGADTIRRLGLDITALLRANPTLARPGDFSRDDINKELAEAATKLGRAVNDLEAAQRLAWKRVRPSDLQTMDLGIFQSTGNMDFDATHSDRMKEMYLEFAKAPHLSELARVNPARAREINTYLTEDAPRMRQILSRMDEGTINYFSSNAAGELGWRLPPGVRPTLRAPGRLADGNVGAPHDVDLQPGDGTPPYTVTHSSGTIPPGLTIDTNGHLVGDPQTAGDYTFLVTVTDSAGLSGTRQIRVVINP